MTREEAVKEIEKAFEPAFANYIITALTEGATVSDKEPMVEIDLYSVIKQKYIEREVLDKIRAEIDRQQKWLLCAGYTVYTVDIALDAIKLIVAESEG